MTRLFITGASGLLGLNAALQCRDRFRVTGTYRDHPVAIDGARLVRLDVLDAAAVDACLADARPEVVLHTAGMTNVEVCERDPAAARSLNVDAAAVVARAATRAGARLIHISSDHLFDGTAPLVDEDASPSPLNVYARTKAEAEAAVAAACPDALIVRTNFYGWGSPLKASFSDWILAALRRGSSLSMFTDVFFTPVLVNDLIDLALDLGGHRSDRCVPRRGP